MYFVQYGTVKETRMVTHKSGAPKGLAYVEYFHEVCYTSLPSKTDQSLLQNDKHREHQITFFSYISLIPMEVNVLFVDNTVKNKKEC